MNPTHIMPAKALTLRANDLEDLIQLIRGQKVLLDRDLAQLYGVPTGALNRAVRRNIHRFPGDFMFPADLDMTNISVTLDEAFFKVYEGEWLDGKPNDQGVYVDAADAVFSGTWSRGCFQDGSRKLAVIATARDCGFE